MRSATCLYDETPLFVMVHTDGRLRYVIEAKSIENAWVIGTGWDDSAGIEERQKEGWKMYPCTVSWEEN